MLKSKLILTVALALMLPGLAFASTAKLQVIHNAADPAAASVDVYVNGDLLLNDFAFRAATPFVEVPAGVTLNIGVAPGSSTGSGDIIATFPVTLESGGSYVAVANGVLDPASFAANPNDRPIGFNIYPAANVRTHSWWGTVAIRAMHGATDAPAVDIRARRGDWNKVVYGNVGYGDIGGTKYLLAKEYKLDVTLPGQPDAVVATYKADLSSLGRKSAFVFASGFLDPSMNQDGAAFGLFVALADGTVLALPQAGMAMARLQVIHNAADPGASEVDIYVNGDRLLDDFAFRAATPFIDVPSGVELNIGVAPGSSESADDIIATFPVTLDAERTYVAMATGVLDPSAFAENPGGMDIGFTVKPLADAREKGWWGLNALVAYHGSTDAPAVDIRRKTRWGYSRTLFGDLSYGEFSDYRVLFSKKYTLQVTPAGDPETVVAAFTADLSGLNGGAVVVFASGFLNPGANQNGAAFGLFAALPDGSVLALPAATGSALENDYEAIEGKVEAGLAQNFPNPFNPITTISFSLPKESFVRMRVFNVRGAVVKDLLSETRGAGQHSVTFDGRDLSSGLYFYRLDAGDFSETRRMTLVK
jgi:hypothetical protein